MTARTGNLREAIARWQDVLDDPRNDDGARAIATRQIRTLDRARRRSRSGRRHRRLSGAARAASTKPRRSGSARDLCARCPRIPMGRPTPTTRSSRHGVQHRLADAGLMSAAPIEPFASMLVLAVGLDPGKLPQCLHPPVCRWEKASCPPGRAARGAVPPFAPWHNVPVVSWLFLRARCATCREADFLALPGGRGADRPRDGSRSGASSGRHGPSRSPRSSRS